MSSVVVRVWGITLGLLTATLLAVAAVVRTGAPLPIVGFGFLVFVVIAYLSYRSGGRYEFEH
ncbi:MAG: htpX protein, partial [Haladaptatus sp.]